MRVLVTGAEGFLGRHVVRRLRSIAGIELVTSARIDGENGQHRVCDLECEAAVVKMVGETAPDVIYHLAGKSSNDMDAAMRANVMASRNVLEAVRLNNCSARVLLIGSAAEYGISTRDDGLVFESDRLAPISNYGFSKSTQTELMRFYHRRFDVDVVMARVFNLYGKGMSETLLYGQLEKQAAAFHRGEISEITVGDLSATLDFVHVDEAAPMIDRIVKSAQGGAVVHVASGELKSVAAFVQESLVSFEVPPDRLRIRTDSSGGGVRVGRLFASMEDFQRL